MPCESLGDPGYRWTPPWLLPGLRFFVDALPFSLPRLCRGPQPLRALHVAPPVGQWLGLLHGLLRPPRPPAYSVPFRVVAAAFLVNRGPHTSRNTACTLDDRLPALLRTSREARST